MLVVGEGEEVGVELGSMVEEAVEGKVGVGEAEALMYGEDVWLGKVVGV